MKLKLGLGSSAYRDDAAPARLARASGRRALRRWSRLVIGSALAAFVLAILLANAFAPRYVARARVLLEGAEAPAQATLADAGMERDFQSLGSRAFAWKAIETLELDAEPEFEARPGWRARASAFLGLAPKGGSFSRETLLLEKYFERFSAIKAADAPEIEIRFFSNDPDLAARAANGIADLFIETRRDARRATARRAADSLAPSAALRASLARAEANLEMFRPEATAGLSARSASARLGELETAAQRLRDEAEAGAAARIDALARAKALPAGARVIERAVPPRPRSSRDVAAAGALAALAGAIFSFVAVAVAELGSGRGRMLRIPQPSPEAAAAAAAVPAGSRERPADAERSAAAPRASQEPVCGAAPLSQLREARRGALCVKALLASCPGANAFEPAVELGRALARQGRVILVALGGEDARYDFLVAPEAGAARIGFSEFAAGRAALTEAAHRDALSPLHVMPGGRSAEPADDAFPSALASLAKAYEFVACIAPEPSRAMKLASLFDAVLVVGDKEQAEALRREALRAGAPDALVIEREQRPVDGRFAA